MPTSRFLRSWLLYLPSKNQLDYKTHIALVFNSLISFLYFPPFTLNHMLLAIILNVMSKLPRAVREAIVPDMLIPPITNHPSKVQLCRISHVYFEHPDLDKFREFAKDFGFVEERATKTRIYFRGYGVDPYVYVASKSKDDKPRFGGAAFIASSEEEFDKAASIEGAVVKSIADAPGGGKMVTFNRPDATFFHVVYGQQEREVDATEPTATHEDYNQFNRPFEKPRQGKAKQ